MSVAKDEMQKHPEELHRVCPANQFVEFLKADIQQSIGARFEQQVIKYPHHIAVKKGASLLTYAELNQAANRISNGIVSIYGSEGKPVAIFLNQGVSLIVAVLGVLKAGRPYVALDTSFSHSMNASVIEDCQPGIILTDNNNYYAARALANNAASTAIIDEFESESGSNPAISVPPGAIAYILYTSGSTGRPKGVFQSHRNVLHNTLKYTNGLHISADDRLTLLSSCSFGASVSDIFGALMNGAALFPFNLKEEGMNRLADWLIEEEITIYHSVPTVYRHLIASLPTVKRFPKIRMIKLGGEAVQRKDFELYREHFEESCIFHVGLGSTEMNIIRQFFCDHRTVISDAVVPVGYEVDDTKILLLDEEGKDVGFNRIGEIAIESPYLACGYWQKEELTKSAFVFVTGEDNRIYRTGDLGRMLPDGCLVYEGRKDLQVKIRGYKVDINGVEATLRSVAGIRELSVIGRDDGHGDKRLEAFIVCEGGTLTTGELRESLKNVIPDYMVPSKFIFLAALPRTANGKIDRNALLSPSIDYPGAKGDIASPRPDFEKRLGRIFADVLRLEKVGVKDDFFDLGGDSLTGIDLLLGVEKEFGVQLTPSVLIMASSVAKLADILENDQGSRPEIDLIPMRSGGSHPPLFLVAPIASDLLVYRKLMEYIDPDQPVYGIAGTEDVPRLSIEKTASNYLRKMIERSPEKAFSLIGYSSGGILAFEMAQQLRAMDIEVPFLGMLDSTCPAYFDKNTSWRNPGVIGDFFKNIPFWFYYYVLGKDYGVTYVKDKIKRVFNLRSDEDKDRERQLMSVMKDIRNWLLNYDLRFYSGNVIYFKVRGQVLFRPLVRDRGWKDFVACLDVRTVPGRHKLMLQEPYVKALAAEINSELKRNHI